MKRAFTFGVCLSLAVLPLQLACAEDAAAPVSWTVDDAVLDVAVWPAALTPPAPPMLRWLGHPQGLFAKERAAADALLADFASAGTTFAQSLDPAQPVRLQRRKNGDVLVEFTCQSTTGAAAALARAAAARGLVVRQEGTVFEARNAADHVVLAGRRHGARVLLFLEPKDPLLSKSHLASLPAGPAPAWSQQALLVAAVAPPRGEARDVLSALLDGVAKARLTVPVDGVAELAFELLAPVDKKVLEHRLCKPANGDVFVGALPATLLGADDRLAGAVGVRLQKPAAGAVIDAADPFSYAPFFVVGHPASAKAAQSLRASFVDVAHVERARVGNDEVLVHEPRDGAAHRTLRAVVDERRFVLSNFGEKAFAEALADLSACAPSSDMYLDGPGLFEIARLPAVGEAKSGPARARRTMGRLFAGAGEVHPAVVVQDKTVTVRF